MSSSAGSSVRHWWQDALVYQVYVRSYSDSDGNGVGDLEGIRRRLGHIASLGVDALWLNPCYPSPQRDHGYDVVDYFDIEPDYGTLEIFDRLVADARRHDIRVLMDVVPNHCSNEHPWFRAALASPPGSAERGRFYFRDGRGEHRDEPPNNWRAAFGGSAWTRATDDPADGQWYLGTFTPHQPDFDHTHPDVERMFAAVLEFWFDRGVEGIRVDAPQPVGKHPDLPDQPPVDPSLGPLDIPWANPYTVYRDEAHDVWRQWRRVIDAYQARHPERDLMMVAETYAVRRPELILSLTRPDEFHQAFNFDLMLTPWHKGSVERALREPLEILAATGTAPAWTLNNHDTQRIVTRLGRAGADDPASWSNNSMGAPRAPSDLELGTRRTRALVGLAFAVPGSLYLYQGEELGLPEVLDIPDDARQDPVFEHTGGEEPGRDGCRVPLPWTADATSSFGFSLAVPPGAEQSAPAWMPQPAWWGERSVESQEHDRGSMLHLYRRLADARRRHAVPQGLDAEIVDLGPGLVALRRGDLLAVMNLTDEEAVIDRAGPAVCSTCDDGVPADGVVPACTTVWWLAG
jgi:alpha-glucosidase